MKLQSILKKYGETAPRYTSYPPRPYWGQAPLLKDWIETLKIFSQHSSVDLYIHIPFCESLCAYCGCSRIITKDKNKSADYIKLVMQEWQLYKAQVPSLKMRSLHLGGGTPNFLTPLQLQELLHFFSEDFTLDFKGSVEIDPRTVEFSHLQIFEKYSFNQISLGVQDFDEVVQKEIHRLQSFELLQSLTHQIRKIQKAEINFDLIYGLPKQTFLGFQNTLEKAVELSPESIVCFSFAYLPEVLKNQKIFKLADIPSLDQKLDFLKQARSFLQQKGYYPIGLDHFAKEHSSLYQAWKNKTLTRNFMGYTDHKYGFLIGLGVTSISESSVGFVQNKKEITSYREKISQGEFPFYAGHTLTDYEKTQAAIIQEFLCFSKASLNFSQLSQEQYAQLKEMQKDGLLVMTVQGIEATDLGKLFLRNIVQVFDQYRNSLKKQSAVI
ncbi:MAG: oxygen-independent coproporphyrinogen III oxidase [Bacteriovoracaceae bacterium]|nr:oxygen-independent coproporphyrinogen III oxidase [Bacteriovoracaceae bacterium]